MKKWLSITAIIVLLDHITKYYASAELAMHKPVAVFPMLNFYLAHNEGAAFSFLSTAGGWQRWFFTIIALVISIVLVFWLRRIKPHEKIQGMALSCILAGAIGNLIDRVMHGYVVDFIQFYYNAASCLPMFSQAGTRCYWPAFNIADSAISIGVALLIYDSVREYKQQRRADMNTN